MAKKLRIVLTCAASSLLIAACGSAAPQSASAPKFPTSAITLIVPYKAGSAPDLTARSAVPNAAKYLAGTILVQNHTGGAGAVGLQEVASSAPTGYTLGMGASANFEVVPHLLSNAMTPQKVTLIAQLASLPVVLFVKSTSPIKSISDWVTYTKAHPGLTVAVDKAHSLLALNAILLGQVTHAQLKVVPVGTGSQALDVLNGSADAGVLTPSVLVPYVQSHQLRIIGLFAQQPIPGLSVPTFWSQGIHVAEVPSQFVFGPKGMPASVVARLASAFKSAVTSSSFRTYARKSWFSPEYLGPSALTKSVVSGYKQDTAILRRVGWLK